MRFVRLNKEVRVALVLGYIAGASATELSKSLLINRNTVNTWLTVLRDRVSALGVPQPKNKKAFWAYHLRRTAQLRGIARHKELDHLSESRARYVYRKGFKRVVLSLAKDLLD